MGFSAFPPLERDVTERVMYSTLLRLCYSNAMKIVVASDSSLLVEFGNVIAPELRQRVLALFRVVLAQRDSRIRNLHPGYASLLIDFDPLRLTHAQLAAAVREWMDLAPAQQEAPARTVTIPVCYDAEFAPDLADVAAHNRLSPEEVVRLHTSATYVVHFLGFSPGFAYLGGLAENLRTPRFATPRIRVPAGAVGIAGDQTGVYPVESSGGWRIIGRTPVSMFDALAEPFTRLQPGDIVRFTAIRRASFDELTCEIARRRNRTVAPSTAGPAPAAPQRRTTIAIVDPGFVTTVQDLGCYGHAHLGISPSGAADSLSFRIANLLVGNSDNAPALEMTLLGATVEFDRPAIISVTGAACTLELDGTHAPHTQALHVKSGSVLKCGPITTGARAYLAVQGGLDVPLVMGSASTHLGPHFGGFEGRPLRAGDQLGVCDPSRLRARRLRRGIETSPAGSGETTLRVTRGAQHDWFDPDAFAILFSRPFSVTGQSGRTGLRLKGECVAPRDASQLLTDGVPLGALQVPPDGQPIILFVDQQTTGGYPKIANVIAADLHRVGQLRASDTVRFTEVSIEEAVRQLGEQESWLSGIFESES